MVEVQVKLLENFDSSLGVPAYQTNGAAGADLKACLPEGSIILAPKERKLIPTGLAVQIPEGFEWQIRPRSGLSLKTGLIIPNSPGTIDCDYRGEVKIILANYSDEPVQIHHGERIAQAVLNKYERAVFLTTEKLSDSERGSGGFGSTGKGD